jgi:hypothetical protein
MTRDERWVLGFGCQVSDLRFRMISRKGAKGAKEKFFAVLASWRDKFFNF